MPLDPGAERLLHMLAASGGGGAAAGDVAERRRMLTVLTRIGGERGPRVETRDLAAPGPGGVVPLRLYAPLGHARSALVYFHGGGWVAGDLETHDGLCRRLAVSAATKLVSVDYRLAPEHRFPAAFEDALAAVRWVAQNAEILGFEPARLAVGGDSVGGGLAAAVAQSDRAPPLALQVLLCPILDPGGQSRSRRAFAEGFFLDAGALAEDLRCYCGTACDLEDPRLSPLQGSRLAGRAPAHIHVAEYDPFHDEGQAYAERLAAAGVPTRLICWPGMIHYFYALPRAIPAAGAAVDAIGAEIAAALG